jgi:hypothetical protein
MKFMKSSFFNFHGFKVRSVYLTDQFIFRAMVTLKCLNRLYWHFNRHKSLKSKISLEHGVQDFSWT